MRTPKHLLLVFVCGTTALLRAAAPGPASLSETIKITEAVAYVRVTHVTEELHENNIQRTATLTRCGRATGLAEQTQIEITWEIPTRNEAKPENQRPKFITGERWVVLLTSRNGRWEVLRPLALSPEGKIIEEGLGAEIGFQPGIDADAAVQLIAAHWKRQSAVQPRAVRPRPSPEEINPGNSCAHHPCAGSGHSSLTNRDHKHSPVRGRPPAVSA